MLRLWKYTLFFLLCLVIALLLNLPVQQILPHLQLPQAVTLAGIDGTMLRGKAGQVTIERFPLRAITYRYLPSCIALLKICYRVHYERGQLQLAYDLLNGDTEVSELDIEYQLRELSQHLPNLIVQPVGRLELLVDDLAIIEGKPAALSGKLVWRDLGIDDQGIKINIGDYQVDFTGNPQNYDFSLRNLEASLEVDGKGQVRANGEYDVDVKIRSETGIDPNVKNVLDLVAGKAGYNRYRIEQKGRLPPHLARQLFP